MKKEYSTQCKNDIMEYLQSHADQRFRAADIVEYLNQKGRITNQATVYRNLSRMTESGLLIKSKNATDECCYYQYADETHHCAEHLHIQCRECGKVIHLDGAFMGKFYKYIQSEYEFALDCKNSIIVGLCRACNH